MKTYYLILSILILYSCKNKENINDSEYRNAEYLFYKKDGQKGYWQKINENSTFQYNKGIINGFYNNGNKFAEVEVLDSLPNRIEKFFNKETSKLMKTVWIKNNSEYKRIYENGYHKHFYSAKGKIIIEEGLVKNNLKQGLWKRYWNENGKLKEIINFKDGKPHGERKNYWRNGNLKSSGPWKLGEQFGKGFFTLKMEILKNLTLDLMINFMVLIKVTILIKH